MIPKQESDKDHLPGEVVDLGKSLHSLPESERGEFLAIYNRIVDWADTREQSLSQITEALTEIRLNIKSMIFDLESTRQERDEFQRQLEF